MGKPSASGAASPFVIVLSIAMALVTTGILATQIRKPTSMISAITRVEESTLAKAGGVRAYTNALERDARREDTNVNAHIAVEYLSRWVFSVETGIETPSRGIEFGQSYYTIDPDNLVARLAYAALVDAKNAERPPPDYKTLDLSSRPANPLDLRGAARPAIERFEAMKVIIEKSPARNATLYNAMLEDSWRDVVSDSVERPDVVASIARRPPYIKLRDYWVGPVKIALTALPLLHARIESLADALEADGHVAEAATCRDWTARVCLGILLSETDAPLRLLCADLIARSAKGTAPAVAEALNRLQHDYRAAVEAAPVDFADQAYGNSPSVAPVEYERAMSFLVLSFCSWLAAIGAAGTLVIVLILWPIVILVRRLRMRGAAALRSSHSEVHLVRPWSVVVATSVLPVAVLCVILFIRLRLDRFYSESSAILLSLFVAAIGSAVSLWLAAMRTRDDHVGRMATALAVCVLAVAFIAPTSTIAWTARTIALTTGSEWLVIPILVALLSTAAVMCGASIRTLISSSAISWCLLTVFALSLYLVHAAFDRQYQTAAAAAHNDEIAARLGADWQKTYLSGAVEHYHPSQP